MDSGQEIRIVRDDTLSRFDGWLGDEHVAEINYCLRGHTMVITHTGTERAWRGHGIAADMTRFALEDARERGLEVSPVCPYTATYISEHREFADLLA
jgi:predicted GNAT family acetyltransferase